MQKDRLAAMDMPPALTEEEFELFKKQLLEYRKWYEDNKPAPQGEYQWEGGYWNGGYGNYWALFHKGKKIGGLFTHGSYAGQYHKMDETGGVYPAVSEPPVPLILPDSKQPQTETK